MGREIDLAGVRLTLDEWEALGEDERQSLLQAVANDPADVAYESYEVSWDAGGTGLIAN
jgi:hypothetical protein